MKKKIRLGLILTVVLLVAILGNLFTIEISRNHIVAIGNKYAQAQEPTELIAKRTANSKTYDLGNGVYKVVASLGALHYRDAQGSWQNIDTTATESDSIPFTTKFVKLPYIVRVGSDSSRRIYPDRNDLSYWLELGKPFPNMGAPVKQGNQWVWDFTNAAITLAFGRQAVKFDILLKNDSAPTNLTLPFTTQGLTRGGHFLYHNGNVVAELRQPYAVDANGVERDVAIQFNSGSVTLSLDDTGLAYPILIDPTVSVGASSDDILVYWDGSQWLRSLTNAAWAAGYSSATSVKMGGGGKFDGVNIPAGADVLTATLAFVAANADALTTVNTVIHGELDATAATFSDIANYQGRRGVVVGGADNTHITSANVTWDSLSAWVAGTTYTSPDFAPILQEMVDTLGELTDIVLFWDDHAARGTQSATRYRRGASWDNTTYNPPALTFTYTSGVAAPTCTTESYSNVEDTTATVTGNITATSENCTAVFVQWGTSTGVYTDNETDAGDYPVDQYNVNLTGLPSGTTIYARFGATNTGGNGYGDEISFLTKPAAPTNVSAEDGISTANVTITWTKSTGATNYTIWRDSDNLTAVGDLATYTDDTAVAGTVTPGTADATDGSQNLHITLAIAGALANNGTTYAYKVQAYNATGLSANSTADNGYRGIGALTYQWYRSSGTDDEDYSSLEGAVTEPYNDTDAPAGSITPGAADASDNTSSSYVTVTIGGQSTTDGAVRWYHAIVSATGADSQNTTHNDGYRGVGAITQQLQRSAADSDADYSNVAGATSSPYNDTGAPSNGDGRYYQWLVDAEGAAQQTSASDRGYRIPSTEIGGPTNLILTDMGAVSVNATWSMGDSATYTMIRAGRISAPATVSEGELLYYGDNTTTTVTGFALDTSTYYISAWGYSSDNETHSDTYVSATIGGDFMSALADAITALGTTLETVITTFNTNIEGLTTVFIGNLTAFLLLLFLSGLAYWHRERFLYIIAGFSLLLFGLVFSFTDVGGSYQYMGIFIIALAIYDFAKAAWEKPGGSRGH